MADLVQAPINFVEEKEFINGIENAPDPLNLAPQQLQQPEQTAIVNEPLSLPADSSVQFYTGPIRRIQPHRTRKTAFGSHEVDTVIIEAIERAESQKSSLPAETLFHCTTNSTLLPSVNSIVEEISYDFNMGDANETENNEPQGRFSTHSYFRNPEVMRSIRTQQQLQSSEFSLADESSLQVAIDSIPEDLRMEAPDLSDQTYERRHFRYVRVEARTRTTEQEKVSHDTYRLQERITQYKTMDPSDFRGATLAEQQEDQRRVLATAAQLLSRAPQDNERPGDKEDDKLKERDLNREGGEASRKPHRASKAEGQENDKNARKSGEKSSKKQKKKSSYVFYEDENQVPEEPVPEVMDEEYRSKKKSKKKYVSEPGKGIADPGKRKGDSLVQNDGEVRQEEPSAAKKKKKYKKIYPKKLQSFKPVIPAAKDPSKSKLLDQAKTYNPKRAQRETNPFGVTLVRFPEEEFEIPLYLDDESRDSKLGVELGHSEDHPKEDDDEGDEDEDDEEGEEDEMEADDDGDREEEEALSSTGDVEPFSSNAAKEPRRLRTTDEMDESSGLSSLGSEDEMEKDLVMGNANQEENDGMVVDTKEDFEPNPHNGS
ncbi:hypothetical protein CPB86DRAFT_825929 [Serendipita vermifera]|nr:hypothetical protein CPB86DRAFT_825929 [Serendipita vermifera]